MTDELTSDFRRFSIIYQDVRKAIKDPVALALYVILVEYADGDTRQAFPSRAELAKQLGFKKADTVDRYLDMLKACGVLTIVPRYKNKDGVRSLERSEAFPMRTSSLYIVHDHARGVPPRGGQGVPPGSGQGYPLGAGKGTPQERVGTIPTGTKPTGTNNRRPLNDDWRPTAEQWSKLKEKHEGKDIDSELEKFRDWHIEKKSQYKDWNRAFDNWLKRARPSKPRQKLFVVDDPDPYGLENAPF